MIVKEQLLVDNGQDLLKLGWVHSGKLTSKHRRLCRRSHSSSGRLVGDQLLNTLLHRPCFQRKPKQQPCKLNLIKTLDFQETRGRARFSLDSHDIRRSPLLEPRYRPRKQPEPGCESSPPSQPLHAQAHPQGVPKHSLGQVSPPRRLAPSALITASVLHDGATHKILGSERTQAIFPALPGEGP